VGNAAVRANDQGRQDVWRGACDMKSGTIGALAALDAIEDAASSRPGGFISSR